MGEGWECVAQMSFLKNNLHNCSHVLLYLNKPILYLH